MGTKAHIIAVGATPADLVKIRDRLRDLERRWTRFSDGSELCRINACAGSVVVVEPDTLELISCAVEGWRATGGRFDPTIGAAMNAVGYDRSFEHVGVPAELRALTAPGCEGIEIYQATSSVFVPEGIELDFGGIGKGFAADLLCSEMIEQDRVEGICINIGGDVRVAGRAPTDEGWIIELAPTAVGGRDALRVGLAAGAVCTSRTDKRHWTDGTCRLHHLLDPETGEPTSNDMRAISVVAASATEAEVLTKAAMVAGYPEALSLLENVESSAVAVAADDRLLPIGNIAAFLR